VLSISGHRHVQPTKKNSGTTSCTIISLTVLAVILLLSMLTFLVQTLFSVHLSRSLQENTLFILDNTPFTTKDTSTAAFAGNVPTATFNSTSDAFLVPAFCLRASSLEKNHQAIFVMVCQGIAQQVR
jgi:hypothetical protein